MCDLRPECLVCQAARLALISQSCSWLQLARLSVLGMLPEYVFAIGTSWVTSITDVCGRLQQAIISLQQAIISSCTWMPVFVAVLQHVCSATCHSACCLPFGCLVCLITCLLAVKQFQQMQACLYEMGCKLLDQVASAGWHRGPHSNPWAWNCHIHQVKPHSDWLAVI